MRRGTTPTNIFQTDTDLTEADVIYISYEQDGNILFEKTGDDIEVSADELRVRLTQEETLQFNTEHRVRMQIRAKFGDGTAIASQVMTASVHEIIKGGII